MKKTQHNQKSNTHKKTYRTKSKLQPKTYIGRLTITKSGSGFVYVDEINTKVEIDHSFLKTALHKDIVEISIHSKKQKHVVTGEVESVVKRSKKGFAGKLIEENGTWFVNPDDPRMNTMIIIPPHKRNKAKSGQKVFTTIDIWTTRKLPPIGSIQKILGAPGNIDSEMYGVALEKGFDWEFPSQVEKEARALRHKTSEQDAQRKDFRNVPTFTIDPFDAKDFDDALSFRTIRDGLYEIGIHIADASFYVTPGTALDREAFDRATSVYLVDRTIPMLPETLSNDLCSLNPNEDKRTFSAVFTMNDQAEIQSEWFGRTWIHSDKRFTYEEAQEIIETKQGLYVEEITTLNRLAKELTSQRFKQGAISLETDEVKFKLDKQGKPIAVERKTRKDAHKMIEEFMLLANKRVARFCGLDTKEKNRLSVYRIHEEPTKEKVAELMRYLELLGYELHLQKGKLIPKEINTLIETLDEEHKGPIQTMIVRSMQKARYSTKNVGHFGLAFDYYTHFTSPIRRYPDIIVHRILQTYLDHKTIPATYAKNYEQQCEHSSEQEKEAMEAERKSVKIKQVEYMADRIGQRFPGIITGLTNWGIYAEEIESRAEGMISLRDMKDDVYVFQEKTFSIQGEKTKQEFKLGDTITIEVAQVNVEEYTIDYKIVL